MSVILSAAALLAGCLAALARETAPAAWEWCALLAALAAAACVRHANGRAIIVFFAFGFLSCHFEISAYMDQRLGPRHAGQEFLIDGIIRGAVTSRDYGHSFNVETSGWIRDGAVVENMPPRLRVHWYRADARPRAGDRIEAVVRVKPPTSKRSGAGFDEEAYALVGRHYGSGYIRELISHQPSGQLDWRAAVERARFALSERIGAFPASPESKAIVNGLANGDRRSISNSLWQLLNRTGTSHLMAISGLHIGLFSLCVWRILMALAIFLPCSFPVARHWPVAVGSLAFTGLYALFCGMSLPTQRALIMLAAYVLAHLCARQRSSPRALATAFIVVVLWQPTAIISAGLWLSFCAVGFLMAAVAATRGSGVLFRWVYVQTGISLFLLPVCLYWFGQSALSANAANAVAIPMVCFVILPLVWISMLADLLWPTAGDVLFALSFWTSDLLVAALRWVVELPKSHIVMERPSAVALALAWVGLLVVFLVPARAIRPLGLVLCLPLLMGGDKERLPEGQARVSMIDIGQGLAIAIETRSHTMIYDTGPGFGSSGSAGGRTVAPWLERRGIERLDRALVSHLDNDHSGGLVDILNRLPVRDVVSNDIDRLRLRLHEAEAPSPPLLACQHIDSWRWDGVEFEILWPQPESPMASSNNSSCVLWIRAAGQSALLLGDIDSGVEKKIIRMYPGLRASVLVVAHHGSVHSTHPDLLAHIKADVALISAGYLNRWRMPRPAVLRRLADAGVFWLSTAEQGTISVDLAGSRLGISTETGRGKRYWHRPRRREPVPCRPDIEYPNCVPPGRALAAAKAIGEPAP